MEASCHRGPAFGGTLAVFRVKRYGSDIAFPTAVSQSSPEFSNGISATGQPLMEKHEHNQRSRPFSFMLFMRYFRTKLVSMPEHLKTRHRSTGPPSFAWRFIFILNGITPLSSSTFSRAIPFCSIMSSIYALITQGDK